MLKSSIVCVSPIHFTTLEESDSREEWTTGVEEVALIYYDMYRRIT